MIKLLAIGLWVIVVTLGSSLAAAYFAAQPGNASAPAPAEESKSPPAFEKARALSVPMIADGAVQGFVVAQFVYTLDPALRKTTPLPVEAFLLDEAFRLIYSDDSLDFRHLKKYDVNRLTNEIIKATNARLGLNVLKEVLIQDLNFVSKEDAGK